MARRLPFPVSDTLTIDGLLTPVWGDFFARLVEENGYVFQRPSCCVTHSANQSIADATWTTLVFDTEDHDIETMHSTTANTDRITIPEAGIYAFGANIAFASDAVGVRFVNFNLNDADPSASQIAMVNITALNGSVTRLSMASTRAFSAADILRCNVYQNSGGALNVVADTTSPFVWCFKVSN